MDLKLFRDDAVFPSRPSATSDGSDVAWRFAAALVHRTQNTAALQRSILDHIHAHHSQEAIVKRMITSKKSY